MNPFFKENETVLFTGDSITDCCRDRTKEDLGAGYVKKLVNIYMTLFPERKVQFYNRGISGDTAALLSKRYEKDLLKLKPDFVSIMIGINDTWRKFDSNQETTAEEYEENYREILSRLKSDLPNTKLLLLEPYLLPSDPQKEKFRADLNPKIGRMRKLALEYADFYIPLDGILHQYIVKGYKPKELSEDGVHPTDKGHSIIAYEILKTLQII